MAKRKNFPTLVPAPQTRAMLALEQNLESIGHMLKLSHHEAVLLRAQSARMVALPLDLATKPGRTKAVRSLTKFNNTVKTRIERLQTITLWQVVILVTCVEAYLQDVLTAAASVDPECMSKSDQRAPYADVMAATSLEALANDLRTRWARGWVSDGGPSRWISRLGKMGARGYPDDLAPRLGRFWGIRHVGFHAAGVPTADFMKRHPSVVAAAGNRVRANHHDLKRFVHAVFEFINPTDEY